LNGRFNINPSGQLHDVKCLTRNFTPKAIGISALFVLRICEIDERQPLGATCRE